MKLINNFSFTDVVEAVAAKSATGNANVIVIYVNNITDKMYEEIGCLLEKKEFNDLICSGMFYVMENLDVTWSSFSEIKNEEDEHWLYRIIDGKLVDYI